MIDIRARGTFPAVDEQFRHRLRVGFRGKVAAPNRIIQAAGNPTRDCREAPLHFPPKGFTHPESNSTQRDDELATMNAFLRRHLGA